MIKASIYRPTSFLCGELSKIGFIKYENLDESIKKQINIKNYYSDIGLQSTCKDINEMIHNFNSSLLAHEDGIDSFMSIESGDIIKVDDTKYYFVNSVGISQIENF